MSHTGNERKPELCSFLAVTFLVSVSLVILLLVGLLNGGAERRRKRIEVIQIYMYKTITNVSFRYYLLINNELLAKLEFDGGYRKRNLLFSWVVENSIKMFIN